MKWEMNASAFHTLLSTTYVFGIVAGAGAAESFHNRYAALPLSVMFINALLHTRESIELGGKKTAYEPEETAID